MNTIIYLITCFISIIIDANSIDVATTMPPKVQNILKKANITRLRKTLNHTRRILYGSEALDTRPYMVYLKLPPNHKKFKEYRRWLCGGVIVHPEYILTSAACIEDVKHFYIIAGTYKYDVRDDRYNNECIKNGARKAIWKCIPRNYIFDGHENDNIRWMNNDIAIVKVDEEFDFTRRVRGCDYIPKPVAYNNQSSSHEQFNPGVVTSVAGWGSTRFYNVNDEKDEPQNLRHVPVRIIDKERCKRTWGKKYYNIIETYMICTEDLHSDPSPQCLEKYVDCKDIHYDEDFSTENRRVEPEKTFVHSAFHNETHFLSGTRRVTTSSGGFCEVSGAQQTGAARANVTSVAPHVRCLRLLGFMRSGSGPCARLYNLYALSATSLFVVLQAVYAYKQRHDMDEVLQVMFLVLCHMTCVAKQVVFCLDAHKIDALVAYLDEWRVADEARSSGSTDGARAAWRLLRVYAGGGLATCVLWAALPVLDRLRGRPVLFRFWTGLDYDDGIVFTVVLLYYFYQTSLVGVGNTTMDAFMAAILDQCTIQTKILRINCERMVESAAQQAAATRQPRGAVLRRHLVACVLHYDKITQVCGELQQVFGGALLVQFAASGWILCMAAYNIVSMNVFSIEFASTTLFIACILVELFLFCYYGNELTVESSLVTEAVYSASWHATGASFRRALALVMERAKRPVRPAAGLVVPLSLNTYLSILKSSYSFYAVLRQTK